MGKILSVCNQKGGVGKTTVSVNLGVLIASVDILVISSLMNFSISSLHDLASKATVTYSDMPRNPNKGKSKIEEIVVKIMELEEEINRDIDKLVDLKTDITHLIKRLDSHEYQILLEQRYLCFKSWEQISVDLGYSIQHTFRLHDAALEELSRFYKDES